MAPHVSVAVFARGINLHLNTRIYFDDEAEANAADPVLRLVEPERRRATLVARRDGERGGGPGLPVRRPPPGRGRDGVPRCLSPPPA
jgi:protocatechuate 3,4-dioxygenase alpha subunit